MSFRTLPSSVLLHVLSFLDCQSLVATSAVNRSCFQLAGEESLWEAIARKRWPRRSLLEGESWVQVVARSWSTLSTDTLFVWGANRESQLGLGHKSEQIFPARVLHDALRNRWVAGVSCSGTHSVAYLDDGSLLVWGSNLFGQLGFKPPVEQVGSPLRSDSEDMVAVTVGIQAHQLVPRHLSTFELMDRLIVSVACGEHHTVALSGEILVWGRNDRGQLGIGDREDRSAPVVLSHLEGKNFVRIASGCAHTIALTDEGELFTWGWNDYGQLGLNHRGAIFQPASLPVKLLQSKHVVNVSCGYAFTIAITSDGGLLVWGRNHKGQLGRGHRSDQLIPAVVPSSALHNLSVVQVACGAMHTLALSNDGVVLVFGSNDHGQLGLGRDVQRQLLPVVLEPALFNDRRVCRVSAGAGHSVACTEDGSLFVWGGNGNGELGTGHQEEKSTPFHLSSWTLFGKRVDDVACGYHHTICLPEGPVRIDNWGWFNR